MAAKRNKPLPLEIAKRAQIKIEEHDEWWRENRQSAKITFKRALRVKFRAIQRNPTGEGVAYEDPSGSNNNAGVRRTLTATKHWVYFMVVDKPPKLVNVTIVGVRGPAALDPTIEELLKKARARSG